MGGDPVEFKLDTFQSPILTMYCYGCDKLWASAYENPTCTCQPNIPDLDMCSDLFILHLYYEGFFVRPWTVQLVPFWAYLMHVCPKWVDFP